MRVVVIGGLGNFGARICTRLELETEIEVVATSRHMSKAGESTSVRTAILDIYARDFRDRIRTLAPDLVIHCAGPFQGQDYRVALASLAAGAHYIDLADGREFVAGFTASVGPAAEAAKRIAITGASTLPALSSAVVDFLKGSFAELNAIDVVIAPGQRATRGTATVAAVIGYAGKSFPWWECGKWRAAHGWQELKHQRFSFGNRLSAACDVPDLELFPARYAGVQSVTFRAALEVSVQHYGLWTIGAFRRMGLPIQIARSSSALDRIGTWLNWFGSATGGMTVRVTGRSHEGEKLSRTWELTAKCNDGPEIPCMAAVILAIQIARGNKLSVGAMVCMGILGLPDFEAEFARWSISTKVEDDLRIGIS